MEFFPAAINELLPREGVERTLFDSVNQLSRFALRRNEVEPTTGGESIRPEAEDASRDGIAVVMIVKEPAVHFAGAELGLNCLNVGHEFRHSLSAARGTARPFGGALLPRSLRALCGFFRPRRF